MAQERGLDARSDGEHRLLLEAGAEYSGRRSGVPVRDRAGRCVAGQGRHRAQDRPARCALAGALVASWNDSSQLHSAAGATRIAGSDEAPQADGPGGCRGAESRPKGIGRRNVKIGDVLSDVFGLSGQLMLEALVAGQRSAGDVAQLARGHARKKIADLTAALEGHQMRDSHRFLITRAMRHMAFLADEIEVLDHEIARRTGTPDLSQPDQLLQTIPGIRTQAAATLLAEGGPNMKQFPGASHFSSWSGIAPGNNESAGKRKRAPTLHGNPHMKTALVESAWSASRTNGSEFQDRYQRLQPRIGHKRAIVAVAHLLALRISEVLESVYPTKKAAPPTANLASSNGSCRRSSRQNPARFAETVARSQHGRLFAALRDDLASGSRLVPDARLTASSRNW